jgi:prepilin-type N-terminal cleavage/methylation domain-containing protein
MVALSTVPSKGFSLIELLIVVAIILIIAAIAIPNLLRARIAADESSAASSVRTVNTVQISYQTTHPTQGYAGSTAEPELRGWRRGGCGEPDWSMQLLLHGRKCDPL